MFNLGLAEVLKESRVVKLRSLRCNGQTVAGTTAPRFFPADFEIDNQAIFAYFAQPNRSNDSLYAY
jgi:hypothetical protein